MERRFLEPCVDYKGNDKSRAAAGEPWRDEGRRGSFRPNDAERSGRMAAYSAAAWVNANVRGKTIDDERGCAQRAENNLRNFPQEDTTVASSGRKTSKWTSRLIPHPITT